MSVLLIAAALLVLVAGVRARSSRRAAVSGTDSPRVTDDLIRRIERGEPIGAHRSGDDDEALDLAEIADAEQEFWDETWDEPDEPFDAR